MSILAPAKSVASVSLLDADRDPEAFSQELGGSFARYGFAIVSDHGIPADLIGTLRPPSRPRAGTTRAQAEAELDALRESS